MTEPIPATVCVGFRPIDSAGGVERTRTLRLMHETFLIQFEYLCIDSDSGHGENPFNRSEAKNHAADGAATLDGGDPDRVLVFADCDTFAPRHQVELAVRAVAMGAADIAFAHNGTGLYLSHGIVRGNGRGGIAGPFPGGIFAIRRSAFNAMGGWDTKFVGWGHEDLCFLLAADRIFKLRIMLSNHPSVGPFFKHDLLYPRVTHEGELMDDKESEAGRLYAKNSRRRDAYTALAPGDSAGYWNLRGEDIE